MPDRRKPGNQAASRAGRESSSAFARWAPTAVAAFALALFAVLKLYSFTVTIGDEHVYFHMAVLVNQGLLPYRDFFYTHPPLHLYAAVLPFHLFGYSLALGKALPNLAMLVSGLIVFALGRRALGPAAGALAAALFLLSFDPLRISSHFTGANVSFALAMAGLWAGYRNRAALAGILFGLATLVAIYVLPGAAAVILLLWRRSRRQALRFLLLMAAVILGGNLLFYALAGWDYVYQVYITQFQKGPEGSLIGYRLYHRLGYILYENRMLTAGFASGVVLAGWELYAWARRVSPRPSLRQLFTARTEAAGGEHADGLFVFATWFVLYWGFYLSISRHHAYYFTFIMPVFAWFSAYAYVVIARSLLQAFRPRSTTGARTERRGRRHRQAPRPLEFTWTLRHGITAAALVLATIIIVDALYVPYARRRYGTDIREYTWRPLPVLRVIDPLVRGLFWQPTYNIRRPPGGITRYLQHESLQVTTHEQLYAAVRRYSKPGDPIFGEVSLDALVASETGRRVAANLVDTSSYRIDFGLSRIEDWIAAIEADGVRLLVVRERTRPMVYPAFRRYARRNFDTVARVRDPLQGEFRVMRRRESK